MRNKDLARVEPWKFGSDLSEGVAYTIELESLKETTFASFYLKHQSWNINIVGLP